MRFDIGQTSSIAIRRFTLYLPERDREGKQVADIEFWVSEACFLLCLINGGCTRQARAEGMWFGEKGEVIREPVHIIHSAIKPDAFFKQIAVIRAFIQRFGRETNQETIAVEFDGKMFFIPINPTPMQATA